MMATKKIANPRKPYDQTLLHIGRYQMILHQWDDTEIHFPVIILAGVYFSITRWMLSFTLSISGSITQAKKRVKDIISLPAISSLISSIPMDGDNKVVSEHRILRHILVYTTNSKIILPVCFRILPIGSASPNVSRAKCSDTNTLPGMIISFGFPLRQGYQKSGRKQVSAYI